MTGRDTAVKLGRGRPLLGEDLAGTVLVTVGAAVAELAVDVIAPAVEAADDGAGTGVASARPDRDPVGGAAGDEVGAGPVRVGAAVAELAEVVVSQQNRAPRGIRAQVNFRPR